RCRRRRGETRLLATASPCRDIDGARDRGDAPGMARGFTLREVLGAMAGGGLVMAGTLSLLLAGQGAYSVGEARAEAIQGARVGLERMATELRQAGYDPQGAGFAPLEVAEPERVTLLHHLNESGAIDPTPGGGGPSGAAPPSRSWMACGGSS